jgi:hypothetical protein
MRTINSSECMKRLRRERKEWGLCVLCGKKHESGYKLNTCRFCLEKQYEYQRRSNEKRKRTKEDGISNENRDIGD